MQASWTSVAILPKLGWCNFRTAQRIFVLEQCFLFGVGKKLF